MAPTPFSTILVQARKREPEALAQLYIQFLPIINTYVSRRVPANIVEDITSDVFFKMIHDIRKLQTRDELAFKAWLFALAGTAIAGYYRKAGSVRVIPLDTIANMMSPEDPTQPIEQAERLRDLTDALSMITTKRRKIVTKRADGEPYKAIANTFGMKEATVRASHHRTIQTLRESMAVRIMTIILCGAILTASAIIFLYRAGSAVPGQILYPIRQLTNPIDTPTPTPIHPYIPVPSPSPSPTPTSTPTPTPTPAPEEAAPTPTPTPDINTLPVNAHAITQHALCLINTCS